MAITTTDLLTHPVFKYWDFPPPTLSNDPIFTSLTKVPEDEDERDEAYDKIDAYLKSGKDVYVVNAQGKTLLWLAYKFAPGLTFSILKSYPHLPELLKTLLFSDPETLKKFLQDPHNLDPSELYNIKIPLLYTVHKNSQDLTIVVPRKKDGTEETPVLLSKVITVTPLNMIEIACVLNRLDVQEVLETFVATLVEYGLKEKPKHRHPKFMEVPKPENEYPGLLNSPYKDLLNAPYNLFAYLLNGFPVDLPDKFGQTLFKIAVFLKEKRAINTLLAFGADINQAMKLTDGRSANALFYACDHQEPEWVKFWLDHGADVNGIKNVCYPLLIASERPNVEVLKLLLSHDTLDTTVIDPRQGLNALHYAAMYPRTLQNLIALVESKKIDLETMLRGGTALTMAIAKNNLAGARYLIEQRANVNVQTPINTPLMDSLMNGYDSMSELLILDAKADVNVTNMHNKQTPLMVAAYKNNIKLVQLLLDLGADPKARNVDNLGLLEATLSSKNDNPEMLQYLFENKVIPLFYETEAQNYSPNNVLIMAVELNKINSLKVLLVYNNYSTQYLLTALGEAKALKNKECEKILLKAYTEALCHECFRDSPPSAELAENIKKYWCKLLMSLNYSIEADHVKFMIPKQRYLKEGPKYKTHQALAVNTQHFAKYNDHILKMIKTTALEDLDIWEIVLQTTPEYKEIQEEHELKQTILRRNTLIEAVNYCEIRFTKAVSALNIQDETTKLLQRCEEANQDILAINATLEHSSKNPNKPNKNPNKRDRTPGKLQSNIERLKSIQTLKESLCDLQAKDRAFKEHFFLHYEKHYMDLDDACHEERFEAAEKIVTTLEEYLNEYNKFGKMLKDLRISLESTHEAILCQFYQDEKQNRAAQREKDRLQARAQAILEAKTEEEKNRLEEEHNEKLKRERQDKEDALRRQRHVENCAARRREREQKKKYEENRQRHQAFLTSSKAGSHQSLTITDMEKTMPGLENESFPLLLFSKKTPRPLTLNMAGGDIAEQVSQLEHKHRVENETVCLELCVEAAVEMNRSLDEKKTAKEKLVILKMQRNALLGTFAGCMEYLKRMKNDPVFSNNLARKLRNYLFKGKKFLLHEKQTLEEVKNLNEKLIHMIYEVICCMRTEEMDGIDSLSSIDSELFKELQQAAENLEQEKIPSLSLCKNGIQLANLELKLYESQANTHPLILEGATNYSLAARGTFAMWIRDYYPRSFHETAEYKNSLEGYIIAGNQVRHGEASTVEKRPSQTKVF